MSLEDAAKIAPFFSALAACVAALVAATSAGFAGFQVMLSRRTATLQVLQVFDKAITEREAALAAADTDQAKEHAFIEFLNFLELYAGIANRTLLAGLALELVRDRLIDSVVVIERAPAWHDAIDNAIFHQDTFGELRKFLEMHRALLKGRRAVADTRVALLKQKVTPITEGS